MELDELKAALGERDNAILGRLDALSDENKALLDRVEEMEAKASWRGTRGTQPGAGSATTQAESEHVTGFKSWLRKPRDPQIISNLREIEAKLDRKAISIGSDADGGFAVPQEIAREIERLELKFSPVRRLVKVVQSGSSDYHALASIGGTTSGWSSESGTRSATETTKLRDVTPTHGELYAYPQVSNWALDDMFFNVETWLSEEVAQEFAKQEGAAVISGNGTNRPTGMLNTTPVLTTDEASPLRAAAAYQYIASDLDADSSPSGIGVRANTLIDLVYTLNSAYRAGASWIMNSATIGAVRKLKDAEGRYVWTDALSAGQPAMLLGYPVEAWEDMPDIGANNFPIGFGNWSRAYLLVDRVGLRITVDPYTTPGQTKFYVRRREGGHVLNNNAAKFLRTIQ